jgi:PAS domain S-box-containing protein
MRPEGPDETVAGRPDNRDEESLLRSVALQNAQSILAARQRAEHDLREAKAALERRTQELALALATTRVTLLSIGDAVLTTDTEGRLTALNPVAESLTGWTADEALGQPLEAVFRIINEYTRQPVENPASRALREGTVVGLANHTILLARDGTEHPIDDSAAPIRDDQGTLLGVVLVFRDVTERRRAEDAHRRLAAIVASSDDAILGKALDGTITSWNAGAERLYGYTAAEIIGQPFSLLVPPDRAEEARQSIRRIQQGERLSHFETVRQRKGGSRVDVSVSYSPIRDDEGRVIGTAVITRDISERKQADQARLEEARTTEALYRIGQALAAQLDLQQIVQTVTDEATSLTGAQFGAFFYNVLSERGESYMLYTISGVPREAFERFPMPRNTEIFEPTFRGRGDAGRPLRQECALPRHAGGPPARPQLSCGPRGVPVGRRAGRIVSRACGTRRFHGTPREAGAGHRGTSERRH